MTISAVRSAVERVRQGLVELELRTRLVEIEGRRGLGLREIDLGGLVQEEVALRRPACRRDGRRPMGQMGQMGGGPPGSG